MTTPCTPTEDLRNSSGIPWSIPGYMINTELVFDKLINADSSLNPTDGMLAESYTVSEDDKSIEFVLRDGLKWHDDEPLTAEDVSSHWNLC